MVTPVIQEGTALNKVFFDSIQDDFTSVNNSIINVNTSLIQQIVDSKVKFTYGNFEGTGIDVTINLAFTPDLIILYSESNSVRNVGGGSVNVSGKHVPKIITKAYGGEEAHLSLIIDNGFTVVTISDVIYFYIAIKF